MKAALFSLCLLSIFPAAALAQDNSGGMGLDLSDDSQKKPDDQKKDDQGGLDLSGGTTTGEQTGPSATTPPPTQTAETQTKQGTPEGEREIIQDDRVKSVQRKLYLKKHRFEIAPFVSYSVNDPYYSKAGVNARIGYFIQDTLSIGVRGSWLNVLASDDVRIAKRDFQSRIFFSVPQWAGIMDLEWSPLYGKVAWFNSILHFDGYLLGGAGVVSTETSALHGLNPAAELGVGMRFVAKDFLAVNAALINTSYVDQPTGTTKSATQNVLTLNAGISLFLPLKSTTRESE